MAKKSKGTSSGGGGLGGFLGGLTDLIEKLNELAETGKEMSGTGEIPNLGKQFKGVYGFNVKVGLGDDKLEVEPFGNIKKDAESGKTVVQEIREPLVDIFEEEDHALIVVEMPGISAGDLKLDVKDDVLSISAQRGDKKYHKEVLLPKAVARENMAVSCNNGILEIKCQY
ncbi:MAG: Hsp20/alpha crystallin family protein [Desulfomonilaceae bacterium]